ncbi:helix-turn-helix domain-containing protein [Pararhizobium sp.]|uniref:helix-turn-helix domain-containing protein n=1 Tax=Pararhizobium sp. TaxID=1977563 RepID=UPI00271DED36|nr:helix-turn-helix transcriptional regulator [Pararhizobium sp.]MDO9415618.1 helix-turn-helix transcriptional regulator [Pararhizobium sp.]
MHDFRSDLVRQLTAYRLKVGLTQDDIAWKLGFSLPSVSRWERGVSSPDLRAVGAIVDFLRRADEQTAKLLFRAVENSPESCNIWEGRDVVYRLGSRREYAESPQMREVIGKSIRRHLTGLYERCIEDRPLVSSLVAGEIASVDVYGGAALSITSIPDGFVQMKRLTFQSELNTIIRCTTQSFLIAAGAAPMENGVVVKTWDELSRPF